MVFVDNPSNQYEGQKDSNIQEEVRIPEYQHIFVMLLISRYTDFVQNESVDYDWCFYCKGELDRTGK